MPRVFQKAREPFSSYSHFVGAVLSGLGLLIVLVRLLFGSAVSGSLAAAAVIFCLSLIALYSASSVYHFSEKGEAVVRRLKKLDHCFALLGKVVHAACGIQSDQGKAEDNGRSSQRT